MFSYTVTFFLVIYIYILKVSSLLEIVERNNFLLTGRNFQRNQSQDGLTLVDLCFFKMWKFVFFNLLMCNKPGVPLTLTVDWSVVDYKIYRRQLF